MCSQQILPPVAPANFPNPESLILTEAQDEPLMNAIQHLKAFCWPANGFGPEPWRENDSLFACDGSMVLRISSSPKDPLPQRLLMQNAIRNAVGVPLSAPRQPHGARLSALISQAWMASGQQLHALPALPPSLPCASCSGTGKVGKCTYCDDGLFEHHGHDYECRHCRGTGRVKQIDGTLTCEACRGSGAPMSQRVAVGAATYSRHYLQLVECLPGVEVGLPRSDTQPLYFESHGLPGLFACGIVSALV